MIVVSTEKKNRTLLQQIALRALIPLTTDKNIRFIHSITEFYLLINGSVYLLVLFRNQPKHRKAKLTLIIDDFIIHILLFQIMEIAAKHHLLWMIMTTTKRQKNRESVT